MNTDRKTIVFLSGLLVLAALLRLPGATGYANYYEPELTRDLGVVRGMAASDWPLVGPPQFLDARFHFGPAYYYLMYPLARLADFRPWSLALTSLFFSLATIALGWWACHRWFADPRVAALFAVIASFSALDIQFAKYASNPNLVPFFALLFFVALEPFLRGVQKIRHTLLLALAFTVAAQLHPVAGISLGAVLVAALIMRRIKPRLSEYLAFAAATLTLNATYIIYELGHGFGNYAGLTALATGAAQYGGFHTRILETAAFWFSLWYNVHHMFSLAFLVGLPSLVFLALTLVFLALVARFEESRRKKKAAIAPALTTGPLRLLLTLWLLAPTLLLLIPIGQISQLPIYYFVVLLPLAHILSALGLVELRRRGWRVLPAAILAFFLIWQTYQIGLYHHYYPSLLSGRLYG